MGIELGDGLLCNFRQNFLYYTQHGCIQYAHNQAFFYHAKKLEILTYISLGVAPATPMMINLTQGMDTVMKEKGVEQTALRFDAVTAVLSFQIYTLYLGVATTGTISLCLTMRVWPGS